MSRPEGSRSNHELGVDAVERGAELRVGGVRLGQRQVLAQGPGEDVHLLADRGEPGDAFGVGELGHRVAVDEHLARVGHPQPGHQGGHRGLAGAGGPDDGDGLARVDGEADVADRPAAAVAEADVAQLDATLRCVGAAVGHGYGRVDDDADDPGERGVPGLDDVEHPHQRVHRPAQPDDHQHRPGHRADGERVGGHQVVADRQRQGEHQQLDAERPGVEHQHGGAGPDPLADHAPRGALDLGVHPVLHRERPYRRATADGLEHPAGPFGHRGALGGVALRRPGEVDARGDVVDRRDHDRDEQEVPVQRRQRDHRGEDREQRGGQGGQGLGDGGGELRDVIGGPADQVAGAGVLHLVGGQTRGRCRPCPGAGWR